MSVTSMPAGTVEDRPAGPSDPDETMGAETMGAETMGAETMGVDAVDAEPVAVESVTAEPAPATRARRVRRPDLVIRRNEPEDGPAFWRWDCGRCGEYGGGRHHCDALSRALRHCAEHPDHRSSLLPPTRCRIPEVRLAVHPMLYAVDDDPPPVPLST